LNTKTLHESPFLPVLFIGILVALATVVVASIAPTRALAQDSETIAGYRIVGEAVAGSHTIELQVSPEEPIAAIVRFAVRVRNAATGADIDDAIVRVFATPSEKGERQFSPALNSPVDPVYYLAQLDVDHEGIWAIDVEVESELGNGSIVMSVDVQSRGRSGTGNGWGQTLFALVVLSFAIGIGWLVYSSKKALKCRDGNL
jgi:hypothetical protein